MKLLFATGNTMKYKLMRERLSVLPEVEVVIPKMLDLDIEVVEDGMTPTENAIKKAKTYYDATNMAVIAEDSGLYIDEFKDAEQPGLFVKRVNGVEGLSDEEVINHYITKLNEHGGTSLASYHTGVCLIDEDGNMHTDLIKETKFLMTSDKNKKEYTSGGCLDAISIDLECGKYFNERTEEEKQNHYKELDSKYQDLVKTYILKK